MKFRENCPPEMKSWLCPCMQVYGHIVECSSINRKLKQYPALRGDVQSVCIHVYLEIGEPFCDAAGSLKFYLHPAVLKCRVQTEYRTCNQGANRIYANRTD